MKTVSKVESAERKIPLSLSAATERVPAMWVSWNAHRRTSGLCAAWDLPLHVIPFARGRRLRLLEQAWKTLELLRRKKPEILFVQNPSLALSALALSSRRAFGYYLVVDAHNEGVRPFARRGRFVGWLTRRLLAAADATIVTNAALAKDVVAAGGRALVLSDSLPGVELPAHSAAKASTRPSMRDESPLVVVISSFMVDEPIAAILEAAAALPEVRFAFTGDARRFRRDLALPRNVRLTGYLADKAFWGLLSDADVICDLTLKPDCLVCGAYEGLALAKPMVLSDNPPTRDLFGPAAILTGPRPDEIAAAVRAAFAGRERLADEARRLRETYRTGWQVRAGAAWQTICSGAAAAGRSLPGTEVQ